MFKGAFLYSNSHFRWIRYKLLSKLPILVILFLLKLIYTHFSPSDVFRFWSHPHCPCSSLFSSYASVDIDRLTFSSLCYHQCECIVALCWFESMQTIESETSTIGANWLPFLYGFGLFSLITISAPFLSLSLCCEFVYYHFFIHLLRHFHITSSSVRSSLCAVILCLPLLAFSLVNPREFFSFFLTCR